MGEAGRDEPTNWRRRVRRWLTRALLAVVGVLVGYALFLLVGLIPINRGFESAVNGVEVFVREDPVHTDLIFPIRNELWDWSEQVPAADFPAPIDWATHYAIGWGDRGFYLDTPTWADLKASTALWAIFWPSDTVVHVSARTRPTGGESLSRIVLTNNQYRELCQAVAASWAGGNAPQKIPFSYGRSDAFYHGTGAYHCLYTCNSWAGAKLRSVGVSTPLFTPLPGQVGMYLPEDD